MNAFNSTHDETVRKEVQDELRWIPEIQGTDIRVGVEDSVVTLSGAVQNHCELLAAKSAALRVRGVIRIVDNLKVLPSASEDIDETDIAREVSSALVSASDVPYTVKAFVDGGHVVLSGEVDWQFQREAADRSVRYLRGVEAVDNRIALTDRTASEGAAQRIKEALIRNVQLDAHHITVIVSGSNATLTGDVRSWAEKAQAGDTAWSSPSIAEVDNHLEVRPW